MGDTIVVRLPGGGYALGVIGIINADRMLCTTFSPTFKDYPGVPTLMEWYPDSRSRWIVDTVGLNDGSWPKIAEPSAISDIREFINVRHLPRFKCVGSEGPMLAEYDPVKLYVTRVVESLDEGEYDSAPSLLPQDATTFEYMLSRLMGSPCEIPDGEQVKLLNRQRIVVGMIRDKLNDLSSEIVFDHTLVFASKRQALDARRRLIASGFDVSEPDKVGWFGPTIMEIHFRSMATFPSVLEQTLQSQHLAQQYGAEYDGVGALIP